MLDILVWLFGPPSTLTSLKADEVRPFQTYAGEDVADVSLRWDPQSIIGNVHLSRVAHADSESVVITGTSGTAILDDKKVSLLGPDGITMLSIQDESSKQTIVRRMIRGFGDYITDASATYPCTLEGHYDTVITSDAARKSQTSGISEIVQVPSRAEAHFEWPIITPKIEKATIEQMHASLSIYNRSGIYEVFEDRWKDMHGLKHALVCSSGTIAILVSSTSHEIHVQTILMHDVCSTCSRLFACNQVTRSYARCTLSSPLQLRCCNTEPFQSSVTLSKTVT